MRSRGLFRRDPTLSEQDAAAWLDVSTFELRKMQHTDDGPKFSRRLNGEPRYHPQHLNDWLEAKYGELLYS